MTSYDPDRHAENLLHSALIVAGCSVVGALVLLWLAVRRALG